MIFTLRVSDQAKVDLLEIWCYIAENNRVAADGMIDKIIDIYQLLLASPEAGQSRPELRQGVRSYTVRPYIVFYRQSSEHVDILRVLHGARDLEYAFGVENVETFKQEEV